jgi:hypothetical protein
MRNKTKGNKTQAASYKAVVASVTKEMAQPRVAGSAQLTADERSKKKRGEPTSHHTGKAAKPHIEEYGTGTPTEETS